MHHHGVGLPSGEPSLTTSGLITCTPQVWRVSFPDQARHLERLASRAAEAATCAYCPEPSLFHRLFPYHFVMNEDMKVVQVLFPRHWCCLPATLLKIPLTSIDIHLQLCLPILSCPSFP